MSTKLSIPPSTKQDNDSSDKILESDGKLYYRIKNHNVSYHVSELKRQKEASLVDRGANGGFAGEDVRVLEYCYPNRMADVAGIEDHTIKKPADWYCGWTYSNSERSYYWYHASICNLWQGQVNPLISST